MVLNHSFFYCLEHKRTQKNTKKHILGDEKKLR
nr:MAG TPA: hypothetical protein [Bacteriophage sp.]